MMRATMRTFLLGLMLAVGPGAGLAQETPSRVPEVRADEASYGCLVCHADKRRTFRQGVHSDWGIRCHDCHGGVPTALETSTAHAGDFVGVPDKLESVSICTSCHGDPDQMRQYGLPADQLAELRTSRHGQLLDAGNQDAPSCADCHDPHTTLRANDARSAAFPTNIPATCARCHENAEMMGRYALETDQLSEYRFSTHGKALFEDGNFAAPSCIGCHGSHAALPPAVGEIANVCGRCHIDVRRALSTGPHGGSAETGRILLGCTACHSNHGTEEVRTDRIAETCTRCHEADSEAVGLGQQIEDGVLRAEHEMESAREAIETLVAAGRPTSDARFRYRNAWTQYGQLAQIQHSLDIDRLADIELTVSSITRSIEASAEVATEERWEHKLLLVPLWFFALAVAVLAYFRLRRA
jgi:hypothetical protein